MSRVAFCYHCRRYLPPEKVAIHMAIIRERMEDAALEQQERD